MGPQVLMHLILSGCRLYSRVGSISPSRICYRRCNCETCWKYALPLEQPTYQLYNTTACTQFASFRFSLNHNLGFFHFFFIFFRFSYSSTCFCAGSIRGRILLHSVVSGHGLYSRADYIRVNTVSHLIL